MRPAHFDSTLNQELKPKPKLKFKLKAPMSNEQVSSSAIEIKDSNEEKKQSQRESARLSRRLDKEESMRLEGKADHLIRKNMMLVSELEDYSKESKRLITESESILKNLEQTFGPESVAELRARFNNLTYGESTGTSSTGHND